MSIARFALAAALAATGSAASADESWVYFGCYTGKKEQDGKGIYRSKFDGATGKLTAPELAAEMGSPSFLAIHPTKTFLYAVGEGGGKDGGPVVAFALDPKTGALTKLNEGTSGGPGPCHIAISPKGDYAAVANYGGGSTALFPVGADGKLGERIGFVQHKGSGKDPGRQKEPHAHCCVFVDGMLGTVDLGLDRVKAFEIDPAKGLVEDEAHDIVAPAGSGPRHIALMPGTKLAYVCGELDSTVNVVDRGKVVQSLSTLPAPTKGNSTAECLVSPDGKFVYVSNRGHNSVAVFKVKADGRLEAAGHITGDIKTPRNFNIDPSGKWMLIASQDGGKVGVWEIDPNTGGAKETGEAVKVSKCVCVKFAPVGK